MGDKSKIEWTDATWNPIRARYFQIQNDGSGKERIGWHCENVSEGCRNCYAERLNLRIGTGLEFKPGNLYREERKGYHNGEVKVFLDEKMLAAPLRWKSPRNIFVNSMTDIGAAFVTDDMLDRMFAMMALCQQHTFQILTKRPERIRAYFADEEQAARIAELDFVRTAIYDADCDDPGNATEAQLRRLSSIDDARPWLDSYMPWEAPLPNVWIGTSCEDQDAWNVRIGHLRAIPAAVRFVSFEPLLRDIDATNGIHDIDWAIVGGESGPNARPMHPDWARSLRDQCGAAGVAFFHKQNGEYAPGEIAGDFLDPEKPAKGLHFDGEKWSTCWSEPDGHVDDEPDVYRVGKKKAGRTLDGHEHNDMPVRA